MSLNDSKKAAKKLHENQARVEQLTKDWTEKWKEAKSIMQVGRVGRDNFRETVFCDGFFFWVVLTIMVTFVM